MDIKGRMRKLSRRTFLVTGGAGFIGSHLVERLLNLGVKVVVVDDFSTGKKENLDSVKRHKKLKIIEADVNNFREIKKVFEDQRIYYVFHLASFMGIEKMSEEPLEILQDIDGMKNILKLSKKHKVKKLVFTSSSEVVSDFVAPSEEEKILYLGRDIYKTVKLIGERLVQLYGAKYNLPACVVRLFNVYGPRQNASSDGFVVGILMNRILHDEKPTVFGDGLQTRDFLFVKDIVEALIRSLLIKKTAGEIINVARGKQITILGLAEKIVELSGKDVKPDFLSERNVDIQYQCPDIKKMRRLLRLTPKYPLDKGLELTFDWYKENLG